MLVSFPATVQPVRHIILTIIVPLVIKPLHDMPIEGHQVDTEL